MKNVWQTMTIGTVIGAFVFLAALDIVLANFDIVIGIR